MNQTEWHSKFPKPDWISHDGSCVLYCQDCRELFPQISANLVDSIVTDPPYGTASESKVQTHSGKTCEAFDIEWDQELPTFWLMDALRITKDGGSCIAFTDNREVTTLWKAKESAGWHPCQTVTWVKLNLPPQPRKNFCSGVETAIFSRKPGSVLVWNGGGATLNWKALPLVSNLDRKHPTQKPIALMSWLINLITPKNGLVFDPFMGSGTTGVAAIRLGHRFVGIEISKEYFNIAIQRIEAEISQTKLSDILPEKPKKSVQLGLETL